MPRWAEIGQDVIDLGFAACMKIISFAPSFDPTSFASCLSNIMRGNFERQFHEHVPCSRLSAESKINLLRALVVRFYGFTGMGAEQIVRAFLNTKGKVPSKNVTLQIHTSYPEPGVLRHYRGGDTAAWADEVIAPASFRREKS